MITLLITLSVISFCGTKIDSLIATLYIDRKNNKIKLPLLEQQEELPTTYYQSKINVNIN